MNPKSSYAKTVALLLCSTVLFSSFGFTINMHFCQGNVKTISLLGDAQKCAEMKEDGVCKTSSDPVSYTKKDCCSETSLKAETSIQNIPVVNNQAQILVLGVNPYVKLITAIIPEIGSDIVYYNPPPDDQYGRALLVLHQTFLI